MIEVSVAWDRPGLEPLVKEDDAASLMSFALEQAGEGGEWAFGIRFVDDGEMRALHGRYMGDPSSTDIMTFPYDTEDDQRGGDIVISVDTAASNALEHRWETADELRFLLLHGVLHILGWDDHDEAARRAMLDRQMMLLKRWEMSRNG